MDIPSESGLKIASRIFARKRSNVLEYLFLDPVGPKSGPYIADFAFFKKALSLKQCILFETILTQISPAYIEGYKTGGLEGDCILIDTESSFSIMAFVLFVDNYLCSQFKASRSVVIDEILSRLHIISARTASECILGLGTLRNIIDFFKKYLLIIGPVSTRFGCAPKKEVAITQKIFFKYLEHVVETFSIQCICFRTFPSLQDSRHINLPFYYRPTQRVLFCCVDPQRQSIKVDVTEDGKTTFTTYFKRISKLSPLMEES